MLSNTKEAQEYRKNFYQYYHQKIIPALSKYEDLRLKTKNMFCVWAAVSVILGCVSFYYFYLTMHSEPRNNIAPDDFLCLVISFIMLCVAMYFTKKTAKDFENFVKEGVFTTFLSFFGNFIWSPTEQFPESEIVDSALFDSFNIYNSDDYFEGQFKGLNFVISEIDLKMRTHDGKRSHTHGVFKGVLIKFSMLKPFSGRTLITSNNKYFGFFQDLIGSSMQKVELEDVEFNKMFDVVSDDQVEARYLLTPSFIEKYKNLREVYKANDIRASFLDKNIIVAIPCNRDMFKLGDLFKSMSDAEQFKELFEEFLAVLSVVELLGLDSKTML